VHQFGRSTAHNSHGITPFSASTVQVRVFDDSYVPYEDENRDVDKVRVMQEIAKKEEIQIDSIVHVGDGVTDIPCFKLGIGISFNSHNPKVVQSAKCNITDFKELVPLIEKIAR
jgi:phosphoserine phosphatase